MKYISILFLCVTGCAHVSEYNQGCRDGVTEVVQLRNDRAGDGVYAVGYNKEVTAYFCDSLDAAHQKNDKKDRK